MKLLIQLSLILCLLTPSQLVFGQQNESEPKQTQIDQSVMVYYFHYTRRCATCNAVEDVSRNLVMQEYDSKVDFESCNLDEDTGKNIGEEVGVSGQSLIIVSGDKQIDLTSEAFLFARSNPEKLQKLLQKEIDELL